MPATRRSPTRSTRATNGSNSWVSIAHDDTGGVQEVEQATDPVGQVDRERGGVLSRRHQLPEHRLRREPVQDELAGVRAEELAEVEPGSSRTPMPSIRKKRRREATSWGKLEPVLCSSASSWVASLATLTSRPDAGRGRGT